MSYERNIIFFGETGTGKSSAINLILGTDTLTVSNDAQPCTKLNARYEVTILGTKYNLWDTRGLDEGKGFFRAFFGDSSKKELEKFLKERYVKREIDLLVFCVRGSRATKASVKHYNNFGAMTRRLAAPVAIMVTQLEQEMNMEGWWNRNSFRFNDLQMEFDDHVCITTLPDDPQSAESRKNLIELISRDYHWEARESGYYFGSRVLKSTASVKPRKRSGWNLRKKMYKNDIDNESYVFCPTNATSTSDQSFYSTLESPDESLPSSPVVEPPTPRSRTTSDRVPPINTDSSSLGASHRPQPPSGETSGTGSPSHSMFYPGYQSSSTSYSDGHMQPGAEESVDHLNELPSEFPAESVKRRKNYASKRGAFGDVWECDLVLSGESSRMVAVKAVKTITNHEDIEKKLHREWKVWGRLRHKNIVPLLGVVLGFGPLPSMMLKMVEKNRLLGDVAAGLCYLHSRSIIHGDLHSDNVLIDEDGTACLTDFGLSFINEFVGTPYLKSSICGGVQFADPALVQRANDSQNLVYPTKPCDVYSFGGVLLHVISGKRPYDGVSQLNIFLTVLRGERPQLPIHDTSIPQWHKLKIHMCWDVNENKRPSAEDLVKMFSEH